jgi:hypothetical protein
MSQIMKQGTEPTAVTPTFEKVALVDHNGQPKDTGTLSAYPDRLEFDGKAFHVTIPSVRGVTFKAGTPIEVTHGTGDELSTTHFTVLAVGLPRNVRRVRQEFYEALRAVYGETHLTGSDQERTAALEETVREAKLRSARRSIWIGLALSVGGLVLTIVTYANASDSGGGTYIIAYGPMLFGVLTLITGLVGASKYRRPTS